MKERIEFKDLSNVVNDKYKFKWFVYNTNNDDSGLDGWIENVYSIIKFNKFKTVNNKHAVMLLDSCNNMLGFKDICYAELSDQECESWHVLTLFCQTLDKKIKKYIIVCA